MKKQPKPTKHRRRKAAAKPHLRLNLQTFLPGFAVIEEGSHPPRQQPHDRPVRGSAGGRDRGLRQKAYVHFMNLFSLTRRGVHWVTRAKDNMRYHVCKRRKICDLAGCRALPVLGHSEQAIRWQLWSALLLYVLLRFQAWRSDWPHSFARLFTMIRGVVWDRFDLAGTLRFYGTEGDKWRMCVHPQTAYLPGFAP